MNIKKYLMLSSVALMAVACQDAKEPNNPTPTPTPGAEIKFGGEFDIDASSRTVYGDEIEYTEEVGEGTATYKAFPISWIKNDDVLIYSPDVTSGKNQALYKVMESAPAAGVFAKSGDAGVQWGNERNARFFSVYPGVYNGKVPATVSKDDEGNVKFNLNMTYFQTCKYNANTLHLDSVDRFAAVMYADTQEKIANGSDVVLKYNPLTTGIRVRLQGPTDADQIAIISQIKLKAPVAIAGDFTATFPSSPSNDMPTVTPSADGTTYKEITLYTQYSYGESFITLQKGQKIDLNFFIIPTTTAKGEEIAITNDWTIEVVVNGDTKFTKKLGAKAGQNTKLKPGMMHRLQDLPPLTLSGEWDISKWMTYIPRNVYLSEISIPGSWESLNPNFQKTTKIGEQYMNGCRAFHISCRYRNATGLPIELGTDDGTTVSSGDNVYQTSANNTLFETALDTITSHVKADEYMVVMCTFALKSGTPTDRNWMTDVSAICARNNKVIPASQITKDTTVGDVLGKVIVFVNCENDPATLTLPSNSNCLYVNSPLSIEKWKMFPTDGDFLKGSIYYGSTGLPESKSVESNIKFWNTQAELSTFEGMIPYETFWRGFAIPCTGTYSGPIGSGTSLVKWVDMGSRANNCKVLLKASMDAFGTQNYAHDTWYYFGLGGYYKAELSARAKYFDRVANVMNNWFNGQVTNMSPTPGKGQTKLFPVGIVLMNFATVDDLTGATLPFTVSYPDVQGKTTTVNILKLNNRYHKAFDPSKEAFPDKPKVDESKIEENKTSSRAAADGWD